MSVPKLSLAQRLTRLYREVEAPGHQLTASAIAILAFLAFKSNDQGCAWPSVRTISHAVGLSPSAVRRHLRTYCEMGWICAEPRYRQDGGRTSQIYHLVVLYKRLSTGAQPPYVETKRGVCTHATASTNVCKGNDLTIDQARDTLPNDKRTSHAGYSNSDKPATRNPQSSDAEIAFKRARIFRER